jgi:hypothetical protein
MPGRRAFDQLKCAVGWHAFDKWVDGNVYNIEVRNEDILAQVDGSGIPYWIPRGQRMQQTRVCERCGLRESREIRI